VNQQDELEGSLEITFHNPDYGSATEEAALAVPVPLEPFEIQRIGRYLIEADLDRTTLGTFPLRVERMRHESEPAEAD